MGSRAGHTVRTALPGCARAREPCPGRRRGWRLARRGRKGRAATYADKGDHMAERMKVAPGPLESELIALVSTVTEPDKVWLDRAWERLDSLTKPPRSLGKLEQLAAQMAFAQQSERPQASPSA